MQRPSQRAFDTPTETTQPVNRVGQIYAEHYDGVLAYCRRRATEHDAVDATAEVFSIVWRRRDDVPDGDGTRPWLYGVAFKVLSHQRRGANRRRALMAKLSGLGSVAESDPENSLLLRTEQKMVIEAAARLSQMDREILRLAAWEELSYSEISSVLGLSEDSARQRLHRAKKRLAREFRRLDSEVSN